MTEKLRNRRVAGGVFPSYAMEAGMAQKGAGGNPGAVTAKGGDGARGSLGTGRGGGSETAAKKTAKKKSDQDGDHSGQKVNGA